MNDLSMMLTALMMLAFGVNIIVQLTKDLIPIPTKLWCILVSVTVTLTALFVANVNKFVPLDVSTVCLALVSSFIVAFVAMYGFDTMKELWQRFIKGENINDDN